MERTTFCLLFYIRRTKLNRNGEAPIMMRITVNGVRVDASVKKTILPGFCVEINGWIKTFKGREFLLQQENIYRSSLTSSSIWVMLRLWSCFTSDCLKHYHKEYFCKHLKYFFSWQVSYDRFVEQWKEALFPLTHFHQDFKFCQTHIIEKKYSFFMSLCHCFIEVIGEKGRAWWSDWTFEYNYAIFIILPCCFLKKNVNLPRH